MTQLKAICHVRRIDSTGLKDVLVLRLKEFDDKVNKAVIEKQLYEVMKNIMNGDCESTDILVHQGTQVPKTKRKRSDTVPQPKTKKKKANENRQQNTKRRVNLRN